MPAHLLEAFDVDSLLDEIASSDPPAYLHRCFAEGLATAHLSWPRIQQLAACALVVDAVADGHDYASLEPELIGDWRAHLAAPFAALKPLAARALKEALRQSPAPQQPEALAELNDLAQRLAAA